MHDKDKGKPTTGIWLRFLVLVPVVIVMIIVCRAHIHSVGSTYEAWTPISNSSDYSKFTLNDVVVSNLDVVQAVSLDYGVNGSACVTLRAIADGEAHVTLGLGDSVANWEVRVEDGVIIANGANFTGWESIHICVCLGLGLIALLFASIVVKLVRCSWFGYEMVASGGGFLFSLFQCALFVMLFARGSLLEFEDMAYEVCNTASLFVMASVPLMGILALLVSISNISLIRHEGRRPANMLGIAISIVWILAIVVWMHWWSFGVDMRLSIEVLAVVDMAVTVAIAFGECLLLSTIACAWVASRHVPAQNADYLIVLGCGLRADGTPSPLLAGRVDRALGFDRERVVAGDAPAVFVPSGGQGPDEVVSEAQSMARYLEGEGVEADRIVPEDRSTSTRENMAYSREVIEAHAEQVVDEVSVAFSTTNYHVFRGYVCAHDAGMAVEGMGSRTRLYFWPNAFLREFAGLIVAQRRLILQTYLVIAAVYVLAEFALLID